VICDPARAWVYEHGWSTFSPAGLYPATARSPRPQRPQWQTMCYRPETPGPERGFQGEGLLAVTEADGRTRLFVAPNPAVEVPSIRARAERDRIVVLSDGAVTERVDNRGIAPALEPWADDVAAAMGVGTLRSVPAGWSSWYCYWGQVTERDVLDNVRSIDRLGLDIGVVQVDDGHQSQIGDWLTRSRRFGPLSRLARAVTATGRRAGLWTAPFLVGARSDVARRHPDWLVGGAVAAEDAWNQQVRVLDVTHPRAAEHLQTVYGSLAEDGFGYHKLDFLYAGALPGRRHHDCAPIEAYREGLRIIRDAVGAEAVLLGCGAPLLPSIGLVDAMRISPDTGPHFEPEHGDMSQAGIKSAIAAGQARAWQHGRFWINDPDCILARPEVEQRDRWAEHIAASGGLTVSSDPLDALDAHGLHITRELLRPADPAPRPWRSPGPTQ
jgi:alpha-galactosidase